MKKLLSLALVAVMLFAVVAAAVPVGAEAVATADNIAYTEALYFDVKPYIDGYVSEQEWGTPTMGVAQDTAATKDDSSPINSSFFYARPGLGYDANTLKMQYLLWLRWDENNFYIAAKVNDPDGHTLKNGRNRTWDGDAFQVRIDPAGANSVCWGDTFYPDEWDSHMPWESPNRVCDLVFGYCENANGFNEAWDNTNPDKLLQNPGSGMTAFSNPSRGACELAVVPAGAEYSSDSANGITTYEIAIPWVYIDGWYSSYTGHEYVSWDVDEANGAIGRSYGISTMLYNADGAKDETRYNAFLSWGSGISNIQIDEALATNGGSNEVVLSADKVSADSLYNAGYQKYTLGGIPQRPLVANYAFEIDQSVYKKLTYDNESDMEIIGYLVNGERVQLPDGNWVIKWDKATGNEDLRDGVAPVENDFNYISTDGEGESVNYAAKNSSYTMEFDVMVTDTRTFEASYDSALYNWFGGASSVGFQCGYFFADNKFKVVDTETNVSLAEASADFSLNEWHHWVFQYDAATCTVRLYVDPAMENGRVSASAQPIFNFMYRYLDCSLDECLLILRRMNVQMMLDNIEMYNFVDYTKTGNLSGNIPDPGHRDPVPKDEKIDADFTVDQLEDGSFAIGILNNEKFKANNVTALSFNVAYDTSKLTFKGIDTLAESAYTAKDDGAGSVTIKITDLKAVKDIATEEKLLRVIFMPVDGVSLTVEDVKSLVTVKATITSLSASTGDTIVAVSAAVIVVALIGTGIVLFKRKRNHVEF